MQLNYSGSGTIFFKDQEYRCDLYKNTEEGGTMVKISIPKRFAGYLELPLKFDKIAGKLSNGFQFILLKCDRWLILYQKKEVNIHIQQNIC